MKKIIIKLFNYNTGPVGGEINVITKNAIVHKIKECFNPDVKSPSDNLPIITPAKSPCINESIKKTPRNEVNQLDILTIKLPKESVLISTLKFTVTSAPPPNAPPRAPPP